MLMPFQSAQGSAKTKCVGAQRRWFCSRKETDCLAPACVKYVIFDANQTSCCGYVPHSSVQVTHFGVEFYSPRIQSRNFCCNLLSRDLLALLPKLFQHVCSFWNFLHNFSSIFGFGLICHLKSSKVTTSFALRLVYWTDTPWLGYEYWVQRVGATEEPTFHFDKVH